MIQIPYYSSTCGLVWYVFVCTTACIVESLYLLKDKHRTSNVDDNTEPPMLLGPSHNYSSSNYSDLTQPQSLVDEDMEAMNEYVDRAPKAEKEPSFAQPKFSSPQVDEEDFDQENQPLMYVS